MKRRFYLLVIVLGLLLLFSGCQPQAKEEPGENLSAAALRGKTVFVNRCQGCHSVKGQGGKKGPDLTHIATEVEKEHEPGWLDKFLQNPQAFPEGRKMPRVPLTNTERQDLIKYLETLK